MRKVNLNDVSRLVDYLSNSFEIFKADKFSLEQKFVFLDRNDPESRPLVVLFLQPEYSINKCTVALPVSVFFEDRFSGSNIHEKDLDQIFVIAGAGSEAIVYPINVCDLDMYHLISTGNIRVVEVNRIYTAVVDISLSALEKLSFKPFTISL